MIPLLFGETSAGLRQKCLRKILESVLFQNQPGKIVRPSCFNCWFEINRDVCSKNLGNCFEDLSSFLFRSTRLPPANTRWVRST